MMMMMSLRSLLFLLLALTLFLFLSLSLLRSGMRIRDEEMDKMRGRTVCVSMKEALRRSVNRRAGDV